MAESEGLSASAGQSRSENQKCGNCGIRFHCGLEDTTPCWCAADFPPAISGEAGSSCLCRQCLANLIAAGGAS